MNKYVLTIAASILAMSCSKTELLPPDSVASIANVPNATYNSMGWLNFSNGNALRSTLAILEVADSTYEEQHSSTFQLINSGMQPNQVDSIYDYYDYKEGASLEQFENNYPNFISLRHKINSDEDDWLYNSGSNLNIGEMPDHPLNVSYLNSLVNYNGEIQVGDYVHFLTQNGFAIAISQKKLNSANIQNVRDAISQLDYNNLTLNDTIINQDTLSDVLYGDINFTPAVSAQAFVITIEIAIGSYVVANLYNLVQGLNLSSSCKFCDKEEDELTNGNHKYVLKSKYCGIFLVGQFSSASIKHYEYLGNKWKKVKANMGMYNYTPMRSLANTCDGNIDHIKEIGSANNPYTRTKKKVGKTQYVGLFHSKSIQYNERFTKFYVNGNHLKTLNNVW